MDAMVHAQIIFTSACGEAYAFDSDQIVFILKAYELQGWFLSTMRESGLGPKIKIYRTLGLFTSDRSSHLEQVVLRPRS
jgi:hypothetical protein